MTLRTARVRLTPPTPYSVAAFRTALRESAHLTASLGTAAPVPPAAGKPVAVTLHETDARPLTETAATGSTHQLVQIISAGWGSSGYYSESLLRETAKKRVFGRGLPMYLDHPSATEENDRPERSVRDLAATLVEDARYDPDRKALIAEAKVLPHFRDMLSGLAEHVGLSIRAGGLAEHGEVEGRTGLIVQEITNAHSVDYVTKAGRGGKVLALLESTRETGLREAGTFGAWLESRLHLALTQMADEAYGDGRLTRDERITLSSAIGDALKVWTARVEQDAPQLFARDLYDEPTTPVSEVVAVSESDEPAEPATPPAPEPAVPDKPADIPAATGGDSTTEDAPGTAPAEEKEGVMPEDLTTEVKAREAAEQARAEVETKLTEALREAETARQQATDNALKLARFEAVEAARPVAAAKLTESDLPQAARARVLAAVTRDVPLTESHKLDEPAFAALVDVEIKAEAAYLASLHEADGAGKVTGMGGTGSAPLREAAAGQQPDRDTITARLTEAYKQRGMTEQAARIAATGRTF